MRNETGLLKRKKNYYFVGDAYKQSLNCKENNLLFGFTYPILFTPSPEQHDTLQVHAYVFWSGPSNRRQAKKWEEQEVQQDEGSTCTVNLVGGKT